MISRALGKSQKNRYSRPSALFERLSITFTFFFFILLFCNIKVLLYIPIFSLKVIFIVHSHDIQWTAFLTIASSCYLVFFPTFFHHEIFHNCIRINHKNKNKKISYHSIKYKINTYLYILITLNYFSKSLYKKKKIKIKIITSFIYLILIHLKLFSVFR